MHRHRRTRSHLGRPRRTAPHSALLLALTLAGCPFASEDSSVSVGPAEPESGSSVSRPPTPDRPGSAEGSAEGSSEGSAGSNVGLPALQPGAPPDEGIGDPGEGEANGAAAGSGPGETSGTASAPESGRLVGALAAHNLIRAELSEAGTASPPLPALRWSEELAAYAQQWADTLAANCGSLEHRRGDGFGENLALFASAPGQPDTTPQDAVFGWAAEVECWDPGTFMEGDACDAGCVASLNASGCGHYTQLAWRDSREVGCGVATCKDGDFWVDLWVCNYDPPGNIIGQRVY